MKDLSTSASAPSTHSFKNIDVNRQLKVFADSSNPKLYIYIYVVNKYVIKGNELYMVTNNFN